MKNYLEITQWLNKTPLTLVVLLIFCVFFLLSLQGFDVCDEGWYLSFYQQIFDNPESVEYNFAFWLTGVVGGVWYKIFPNGGIVSFRVLALIVNLVTLIISYKVLRQFIKKNIALLSLTMIFFINDFALLAFYYNHFSSLLAVIVVWLLISGLKKDNWILIILAGFVTAANVFARLPNILLFSFVLVFPAQYIMDNGSKNFKKCINNILYYSLGAVLGFFIVYLVLLAFNHLDVFKNAVLGIIDKGGEQDSNHNIFRLLKVYKTQYGGILLTSLKIAMIFAVYTLFNGYTKNKIVLKFVLQALIFLAFSYLVYSQNISIMYAFGFFGTLATIFTRAINVNTRLLALLSLLFMVLLPFGSDGGIHNAGYVSLWFSLPFFFWYILNINDLKITLNSFKSSSIISINHNIIKRIIIVFVLAFFMTKFYKMSNTSYFDGGSRFNKKYTIYNTLANIYTTQERATIINDLLEELDGFVTEGDYLLAYDKIPMINYLTKTKPYMGISWVWVYDSYTFERKLKEAENEIEALPIVVLQKFETIGGFSEPVKDYMDETKEETYNYKRGRVKAMNAFLKRNNYSIVWSNDYFDILKPNSN